MPHFPGRGVERQPPSINPPAKRLAAGACTRLQVGAFGNRMSAMGWRADAEVGRVRARSAPMYAIQERERCARKQSLISLLGSDLLRPPGRSLRWDGNRRCWPNRPVGSGAPRPGRESLGKAPVQAIAPRYRASSMQRAYSRFRRAFPGGSQARSVSGHSRPCRLRHIVRARPPWRER